MPLVGAPTVDTQMEPQEAATASTKVLKANNSHPEAPARKGQRKNEGDGDDMPSTKADMNKIFDLLTKMQIENEKTNTAVEKMQKDLDNVKDDIKNTNETVVKMGADV